MPRKSTSNLKTKKAPAGALRPAPASPARSDLDEGVAETIVVLSPETRGKKAAKALSLAHQLKDLRSVLNEVIEHVKLKLNSRLVQLAETLQGSPDEDEPAQPLPSAKVLKSIEQKLLKLKLKPQKGRLKDLRTLSRLIRQISQHFA